MSVFLHVQLASPTLTLQRKKFCRQGTIGTEDALTSEQISQADIVLLAIDVKIAGRERFAGKKVVEVPTDVAIKSPKKLIAKLHELSGQPS